jgi:hypothetical protein
MEVFMRCIILCVFSLLLWPSIVIGEADATKPRGQNRVTYEEAISLAGIDGSLSKMNLVTHFPDMSSLSDLGRSPEEVCEKLAEGGINCFLNGPVPLIETGFTLGEFCHSIYNQNRRCLFIKPLELRILSSKGDSPYMSFFFKKYSDQVLIVGKLKSIEGQISNEQEAATAIRFFYSPKF